MALFVVGLFVVGLFLVGGPAAVLSGIALTPSIGWLPAGHNFLFEIAPKCSQDGPPNFQHFRLTSLDATQPPGHFPDSQIEDLSIEFFYTLPIILVALRISSP